MFTLRQSNEVALSSLLERCVYMIKFDFSTIPIPLSGKVVEYICSKCKAEFEVPIEMVLEFEEEDKWNNLPISTPPYTICPKCKYSKCVPLDYKSKRGFHHKYQK